MTPIGTLEGRGEAAGFAAAPPGHAHMGTYTAGFVLTRQHCAGGAPFLYNLLLFSWGLAFALSCWMLGWTIAVSLALHAAELD
jgi:hypothetical protein